MTAEVRPGRWDPTSMEGTPLPPDGLDEWGTGGTKHRSPGQGEEDAWGARAWEHASSDQGASMQATLPDAEVRRAIREDLDSTLVVEASAGTGKTTELVARMLAVLQTGKARLSQIVAVTFTEKAAGEMKLRLRAEIEKARNRLMRVGGPPSAALGRLDAALLQLETARIGTIHALCSDLLREHPIEAEVDPLFEVAPEEEAEALFDQAFDGWFKEALASPGEGVRRMLRRRPRGRDAYGPRKLLRDAAWSLINRRDFRAAWRRDPIDRKASIDQIVADIKRLGAYAPRASNPESYLAQCFQKLERFADELSRREAAMMPRVRDYDGLEAELRDLARSKEWRWQGTGQWYGPGIPRSDAVSARRAVKEKLDKILEMLDADLAVCLQDELSVVGRTYEHLKTRSSRLDFLDLLLKTRDLLRFSRAVRSALQSRFSHIFVDEFQDTDPLQAEILLLLASDNPEQSDWTAARPVPGKLFIVGDPKQSIYRFRRADVALYQATKDRLSDHGARVLHLTTSFRSVPSIQTAVNAAFEPVMRGGLEGGQAEYVPLSPFRGDVVDRPTLIALPVPEPYSEWGAIAEWKISESLPEAVGAFIDWLIRHSGWKVTDREDPTHPVPLEARHICILFKRFSSFRDDVTRPYVHALEARRIPHVLVGGKSFHVREEVIGLRNALSAIEWPDDELSVFATLRGPFFALTDDALLAYRSETGALHPLRRPAEEILTDTTRPVAEALDILGRLHLSRNRKPIADTVARFLEATRAHAGLAIWPTGEQALSNVLRVIELARRFEASGAISFRSFVEKMQQDAERGEAAASPVVEEGTEGVRLMTVHRAKGLEFPVVILADPSAPAMHSNPSRYVDPARNLWVEPVAGCVPPELVDHRDEVQARDYEEAVRLVYVAATRARDLLVVPVVGDKEGGEGDGWLDVLNPIVFPKAADRRRSGPALHCPAFGADSVLTRPAKADAMGGSSASVAPGLHVPKRGKHAVVWWDPHVLALDSERDVGLRQQRILQADAGGSVSDAGERAHAEWQAHRSAVLEQGSRPLVVVRTATELAADAADEAFGVDSGDRRLDGGLSERGPSLEEEQDEADSEAVLAAYSIELLRTETHRMARPTGARFGNLVHGVLAQVAFGAGEGEVFALSRALSRQLGATEEEALAAARAVGDALVHPLMVRAARSLEVHREEQVMLRQPDGTVLEGVVDLAFLEPSEGGGEWTVVDFKTDAELIGRYKKYASQISVYVDAIAAASGKRARGVLLLV